MIHLRRRSDEQRVHTGSGKRDCAYLPGRTGADDCHFRSEDFGSGRVGHDYPAILSVKHCDALWVAVKNPAITWRLRTVLNLTCKLPIWIPILLLDRRGLG